mmetsp:Transcript_21830/g.50201  ORF Transcript_21830/g.50201 Transcript_21830/m.50201 type:complete len:237 (-) Transcript_21830:679-1389(-)
MPFVSAHAKHRTCSALGDGAHEAARELRILGRDTEASDLEDVRVLEDRAVRVDVVLSRGAVRVVLRAVLLEERRRVRPVGARVLVVGDVGVLVEDVDLAVENRRRAHLLVEGVQRVEERVPRPVGHHQQEHLLHERVDNVAQREAAAEGLSGHRDEAQVPAGAKQRVVKMAPVRLAVLPRLRPEVRQRGDVGGVEREAWQVRDVRDPIVPRSVGTSDCVELIVRVLVVDDRVADVE